MAQLARDMSTNTEAEIEQMTEAPNILLRKFAGQQELSTALNDASRSCNLASLASLAQRSHALACLARFPYCRGILCSAPSPSVSLPTPPVKLPHVHPAFTQYSTIIVTTPLCDSNCLSTSENSYLQCAASIAECTYWFDLTRMHRVNW
jgi:hypothetical protein